MNEPAHPESPAPFCTVFTPTLNRAYTLPRLYRSLLAQTDRDFEWLVLDDGSTDGTGELVKPWQAEAPFPIRYLWQENAGMHVAINRGVTLARGELFLTSASDDACPPETIALLRREWDALSPEERARSAGIWGLCRYPSGKLVGNRFPRDRWDASFAEVEASGVWGDKCGVFRTAVLREFPFPVFPGEKFQAEGALWRRITRRHPLRLVNEVLQEKEYLPDGLSASVLRLRVRDPHGARMNYREILNDPQPWRLRTRALINFARFSFHAGLGAGEIRRECPPTSWLGLHLCLGRLVSLIDRLRLAR